MSPICSIFYTRKLQGISSYNYCMNRDCHRDYIPIRSGKNEFFLFYLHRQWDLKGSLNSLCALVAGVCTRGAPSLGRLCHRNCEQSLVSFDFIVNFVSPCPPISIYDLVRQECCRMSVLMACQLSTQKKYLMRER